LSQADQEWSLLRWWKWKRNCCYSIQSLWTNNYFRQFKNL